MTPGQGNNEEQTQVIPTSHPKLLKLMEQMNQGHLFQDHRKICANGTLYIRCPYGMNVLKGTARPLDSDPIAPDSMVSSNGIPPPTLDHPWTEMPAVSHVPDEETDYLYMVDVAQIGHPPYQRWK